ncbi:MAG: DHHA1 domain-containing protein [Anaerolineae bacterium]
MTERLYYLDPYRLEFEARVVEQTSVGAKPGVILESTCFYPTSGGQPHDEGHLNDVPVINVFEREDKAIVHVLATELKGDLVHGVIDWERRFDHMQQHTGQHILSQAFLQLLKAETVSFHLGKEASTIDVDKAPLAASQLDRVEDVANEIVFADRPVKTHLMAEEELAGLPLRKLPAVEMPIRIVEVKGFDYSPCGGTHCQRTGEVGLIKITKVERRGQDTRVEFLCGGRALADYRGKNRTVNELANRFSVGAWELAEAVERLAEEGKSSQRELNAAQNRLLDYEAAELLAEAEQHGDIRVVRKVFADREGEEVRRLALRLMESEGSVALLGAAGDKAHLFFARSADLPYDMNDLLKKACQVVGGGGGGQRHFAQGGGPDGSKVGEALKIAHERLLEVKI